MSFILFFDKIHFVKRNYLLWIIFVLALIVRFYSFKESVYFGFDEARDAFISQAIYKQGDLKLIGPAANGITGLNHGVLHWYLIGLFYLLGQGNPFFVAVIYRFFNALALFPIFWITKRLFGSRPGYIASVIFAVSFEATQYSLYIGNPSLAVWSWILLFVGAVIILKSKNKFWGLPLMAVGMATGVQFELFLMTLLPLGILILGLLRNEIKKINRKSWILATSLGVGIISPYILAEFKNGFRSIGIILKLASSPYNATSTEPKWATYVQRWLLMLHDNFSPVEPKILWIIGTILLCFMFYQAIKKSEYRLILLWVFGGIIVTFMGSYNVYYINVGIGTGMIIALSTLIDKISRLNIFLGFLIIFLVIIGNVSRVINQNRDGLIEDIKTQQYMQLSDEIAVVKKMYSWADGKSFTVRVTSMPYKIQTVWAYLFDQFGLPVYGYLPYYETGNVLGFPGYLPQPSNGTTCVRFLLKEPGGGIPRVLFDKDEAEENLFSSIDNSVQIGKFYLEKRISKDKICYSYNFPEIK